ncbi:Hypothetical predicted protein [Mytilus galloprovincialis]|uniref:Reverse transcriptase domain-containing protein n=1 Tax=Mytilus galloprovincialis TaxID=29158 RepID=A0A8B6EVJ3_MYTGA|nr:Hypothetical predicted protein [Mytilus galloprovincialis]
MAEAFITAINSASEEANSPKATPSTCAKEVSEEPETISTTGLSVNVENELRAEISSVKETVNSVNSRMDIFLPLFEKFVSQTVTSGGHQETDREIATSGGQNISQDSRDIATSGGQNSLRHASVANHDNDIDDAISLQPDRDERRGLDLDIDSDNESQQSSVKNSTHNCFQRYSVVDKDSLDTENVSRDILGDIFGEDAKTKPDKSEAGIVLDQSQINILNQSWHCDNPLLLSTYKEEYRASFPVSDKSADILNLPKLDDITQTLLCKRHGPNAGKAHNKLFSKPEKIFENMAFKGQSAARMGLIITAYMQQALGSLMEKPNDSEPNIDLLVQMVKDIFAMSVKYMDQTARTGLEDITELNDKFLSLKLSSDGVLGKDFEEKLKNRSETNKQIKDLLPELTRKSAASTSSFKKSAVIHTSQDTNGPKLAKNDFSNFRIPKVAAKPSENKGGFKPNFRRFGSGRKEADGEKKGSFRGNGAWAISLDLKDAYFHIPIHETHKKYLRFCVNNQCYQFLVLCFGPTSAPRIFTKVCSVVAAHLRAQNIRLATYLDDWFLINQTKKMLISDREKTLNLLTNLGFVVNLEKSSLIPTQSITYIGAVFSLKEGIVRPTSERVSKLLSAVELILNKQNQATARDFLQLLGIMASCIELIPNARLFMRPIQLHLLYHWKPVCQNLGIKIPFSKHLKGHLRWWLKIENLVIGRSITPWETSITVTTDASNSGYGGHINNSLIVQGTWSVEEKLLHINSLEMEAVFLTVKHFLPKLINKNVLIRSDNATVVRYINKQGGTRSPSCV